MMEARWLATLACGLSLLAAACSPARPAPTGAAAPDAGPREAWQDEWDRLVAAAQQEGKLNMFGPQGDENRRALTEPFEKRFGISIEYQGAGGPEVTPRVNNERGAGLYNWDVFMQGTTTLTKGLKPIGALDPIEPVLLLPEVKDPAKWRGGELPFFESDHIGLSIFRRAGQYFYRNTEQVRADELRSWRDLLDPKWKGRILVGRDPRLAGYGRAMFLFFYIRSDLGPDFIRELAKQDLQILRNDRQAAEWLVQGRYALCFCSDVDTQSLIDNGLPGAVVDPRSLKEGSHATSAYANIAMANRAPHPNTAKLYVNWLLSQEGITSFTNATHDPPLRVDVSTEGVNAWAIPDPSYPITNQEDALNLEEPLVAFLVELFGPP
jgi:iron(III) transport system substrate-binding protein